MHPSLQWLIDEIENFPQIIRNEHVYRKSSSAEIRAALNVSFNLSRPESLTSLLGKVGGMLRQWNVHATHPGYFGLFTPATKRASVVADAVVALYNPQLAGRNSALFANELEQFTIRALADQIGLSGFGGHFTTGGAESNLSAVVSALTHAFPAFGSDGIRALSGRPVFYLSDEGHGSFDKIAHMTGLGRGAVRRIRVDSLNRLSVEALAESVRRDRRRDEAPFLVVATIGTTATGAIDEIMRLVAFCQTEGLWLHVDAAWAGSAALVPQLMKHFEGIGHADSFSWDASKWMSVSMGAGMYFTRHGQVLESAFGVEVPYAPMPGPEPDPYRSTIQWSRRFIGLKVFLTIAEMGWTALREEIERMVDLGEVLRAALVHAGWHILNNTPLPLVCFTHPAITEGRISVEQVLKELHDRGNIWVSRVNLRDHGAALRACVTHFESSASDADTMVSALSQIVEYRSA
jgi:glutamate/tyrosine decarboxylase-like PLP-dependent enzyme